MSDGLLRRHLRKGHDNQPITDFALVRRRAVQATNMTAAPTGDCVRLEPIPILNIRAKDFGFIFYSCTACKINSLF